MTLTDDNERELSAPGVQLANLPALDGLRGLAVAAVLLFHAQYTWMGGGFLGVSAFFTLSGFLITMLLLIERRSSGSIDLRHFWSRRARRLLPAALVALGGILLYGAFVADPEQLRDLRGDVFSALGYFANWHFLYEEQSYAEIFSGAPSPVLHFWSLAIEEQFYLVFPLLAAFLLWAGRGRAVVLGSALAVLTAASIVLSRVLASGPDNVTQIYYGTFTRAAELLIGGLLAVVLITRRRPSRGRARTTLGVLGSASFVAMLVLWSTTNSTDGWLYEGGFAVHAVLVAFVLAESLLPGPLASFLSIPPLRLLGRISYGMYLYHWPVYLWLSPERLDDLSDTQVFVLRIAVTLALATASFFLIERPVRVGAGWHVWWPRVAAPVALGAIVAGAIVVKPDVTAPSITFAPISAGKPPEVDGATADAPGATVSRMTAPLANRRAATEAEPDVPPRMHRELDAVRPLRVLVVGDSVGQTFGRGLELWGIRTGKAQVWNDARYYCSLGRYAPRVYGMGDTGQDGSSAACDSWGERWPQALEQFDPDVVVVLYTFWEMVARKPPGSADYLVPGDPVLDRWQLQEYTTAVDTLSARGAKVVWLTIPCSQNDQTEHLDVVHHLNDVQLEAVAERRPKQVRLVDLNAKICPNDEFQMSFGNVAQARPDGAHFSDEGAAAVGDWLMQRILAD
jgi:peptidoglycan/LPS O-acetylase OafA/YrhL